MATKFIRKKLAAEVRTLSPSELISRLFVAIILSAFLVFMGETFWPIYNAPICKSGDNIVLAFFSGWIFVLLTLRGKN